MAGHQSWVAGEGVPFILISSVPAVVCFGFGWTVPAVVLTLWSLFVIWFFRNPERIPPPGEERVVSPADGKVIEIRRDCEREFLGDKGTRIAIFMNVFNVHVNRSPAAGTISKMIYRPGRFFSANLDKASSENERKALILTTPSGEKILFIQIAGLIARRIVSWVREGDAVLRGERFGMIRFGSRVDVYLPAGAKIAVNVGDKVKAGESVLGEMQR